MRSIVNDQGDIDDEMIVMIETIEETVTAFIPTCRRSEREAKM